MVAGFRVLFRVLVRVVSRRGSKRCEQFERRVRMRKDRSEKGEKVSL